MAFEFRAAREEPPWAAELAVAALGLLLGVALMPVLIFYAGVATLGRFEGASLGACIQPFPGPARGVHRLMGGASWAPMAYICYSGLCAAWWRAQRRG